MLADVLTLAGAVALVAGVSMVFLPAGVALLGVLLILVGRSQA